MHFGPRSAAPGAPPTPGRRAGNIPARKKWARTRRRPAVGSTSDRRSEWFSQVGGPKGARTVEARLVTLQRGRAHSGSAPGHAPEGARAQWKRDWSRSSGSARTVEARLVTLQRERAHSGSATGHAPEGARAQWKRDWSRSRWGARTVEARLDRWGPLGSTAAPWDLARAHNTHTAPSDAIW